MGFLDTAKEKATQFTELAKKKVDDLKGKRKSGALLTDLGRPVFRQRTGRGEAGDDAAISKLITELQALEAHGTSALGVKDPAPTTTNGSDVPALETDSATAPTVSATASADSTTLPAPD